MNSNDNTYIKFDCLWNGTPTAISTPDETSLETIEALTALRNKLYEVGVIGMGADGIGFGNVSVRHPLHPKMFWISGTQTGGFATLTPNDYSLITAYDIHQNKVYCTGKRRASAETLTHAAVYEAAPNTRFVAHIHAREAWQSCMNSDATLPIKTDIAAAYGTPAMALAIKRAVKELLLHEAANNDHLRRIVVMSGHEEGFVVFGTTTEEVYEAIKNGII